METKVSKNIRIILCETILDSELKILWVVPELQVGHARWGGRGLKATCCMDLDLKCSWTDLLFPSWLLPMHQTSSIRIQRIQRDSKIHFQVHWLSMKMYYLDFKCVVVSNIHFKRCAQACGCTRGHNAPLGGFLLSLSEASCFQPADLDPSPSAGGISMQKRALKGAPAFNSISPSSSLSLPSSSGNSNGL